MNMPFQITIIALTILALVVTSAIPKGIAPNPDLHRSVNPKNLGQEEFTPEDDTESEEHGSEGWWGSVVDSGSSIVTGAKDATVDGASAAWDLAEEAPGATWDIAQQAPGAIWGVAENTPKAVWSAASKTTSTISSLAIDGWNWFSDSMSGSVEWEGWGRFLEDHPYIGLILGPLVWLLSGLTPDGSIAYWEIALGVLLLVFPFAKVGNSVLKAADSFIGWLPEARSAASTIGRNPDGIISGARDTLKVIRAKAIPADLASIRLLPPSPGVYIVRDASDKIIYIGMSKSLRQRLTQHFTGQGSRFADEATTVKTINTRSSLDALKLECRLIKQYRPKYNITDNNGLPCRVFAETIVLRAM